MALDRGYRNESWRALQGVVLKAGNKRQEVVEEIGKHGGKRLFFSLVQLPHRQIQPS
jgi:hypothetical protein